MGVDKCAVVDDGGGDAVVCVDAVVVFVDDAVGVAVVVVVVVVAIFVAVAANPEAIHRPIMIIQQPESSR